MESSNSLSLCSADFTYNPSSNCAGQVVQFFDHSSAAYGYIVSWTWNFGDGSPVLVVTSPPSPTVMHLYTNPGTYLVTLSINTSASCTSSKSQSIFISPNPVANFSFSPGGICVGATVQFTDLSQTSGGGSIVYWNWDFGDPGSGAANQSALQNPVHVFNSPGVYSVSLIATGNSGCSDTVTKTLTVNQSPIPALTGPATVCAGSGGNVYTTDPGMINYLWSVNGGIITGGGGVNNNTVTVTWNITGNQTVSVNYTTSAGCTATSTSKAVTVNPNPVANAGPDQTLNYGSTASLTGSATSGSGNYTWHWEPANLLVNSNVQNPVTVNLTASVQFTLNVTDASGCTGIDQMLVSVTGGPLSVIVSANPDTACEGTAVLLNAIASGGAGNNTYTWTSDPPGFTASTYNPVAYPQSSTTYKVIVFDGFASVSDSVYVKVKPLPVIPASISGPDTADLHFIANSEYNTQGGAFATSYTWEINPPTAGSMSGTGTTVTVHWNANFLGTASITVRAVNSCGASAWTSPKVTVVINSTTSSGVGPENDFVMVCPNPSNGLLDIRLKRSSLISVYSASGKLIKSVKDLTNGKLDLSDCPRGVYILWIESAGMPLIRKKIVLF